MRFLLGFLVSRGSCKSFNVTLLTGYSTGVLFRKYRVGFLLNFLCIGCFDSFKMRFSVELCMRVQMSHCVGRVQKWWQKGIQPNMREITSAQDLQESLLKAGDKLVVVDFFLPGCPGCRAFHPKICQFAEMNPDIQFLQVNKEEHQAMCDILNVHVLPFYRFYRGAHGRLCNFSCNIATIKKFRDALAKYNTEKFSVGPAKGLEESELMALAANRNISFNYVPEPTSD